MAVLRILFLRQVLLRTPTEEILHILLMYCKMAHSLTLYRFKVLI